MIDEKQKCKETSFLVKLVTSSVIYTVLWKYPNQNPGF
jgi:hypothetical protein